MTQQIGGYPPSPSPGAPGDRPTTHVARDEATDVGRTAADAGRQVAGTAAEQVGNVGQEVKAQARDLVGEARGQVRHQARSGQQKAAESVRSLSRELREMADGGQQSGTVSEIARQAAARADDLAGWLGDREPADLLDEVRSFARRRPGVFLLGMAAAGVVVGRLTRGAVDSARNDSGALPQRAYGTPARLEPYGEPGYARTPGTPPYDAPLPYDGPAGTRVPPTGPATSGPFDTPTPPEGIPVARPYDPAPVANTLPTAPPHGSDPFAAPADPAPRHAPDTVGEYGDELGGLGERGADTPYREREDDVYRPGGGEFR
jgi:hypothetical protein